MLIVISHSKTLDFESKAPTKKFTTPVLLGDATALIEQVKEMSINDLTRVMNISYGLAEESLEQYKKWSATSNENAKQAAYAFKGDLYQAMDFDSFTEEHIETAQKNLRILSGLYGILRPLDMIQPYRFEMNVKLRTSRGKDMYRFWDTKITDEISQLLETHKEKVLLNLASNEYFKAIVPEEFKGKIVTPVFKESKTGSYRVISIFAKRARGHMARYIIQNKIENPKDLKDYNYDGYKFDAKASTETELIFKR